MSIALLEAPMARIPVMLDADSDVWLATQVDVDRIAKSERIRALVALARADTAVAERAKQVADDLRHGKTGPYANRVNVTFGTEETDWLDSASRLDRINRSERVRALVFLARTDPAIAARAIEMADVLRRAKRGGGG